MKKIATIIKTIFYAAVVLVMTQGCIPTEPVVNPSSPSGSFDVNINNAFFTNPGNAAISSKVVVVDNDSIFFTLERNYIFADGWEYLNIYVQSQTGHQYEFYASNSGNDEGNCMLPAGILVGNVPDTGHFWDTFNLSYIAGSGVVYNLNQYANFDKLYTLLSLGTGFLSSTKPFWDKIPVNQDRFIVFRILKENTYQYYWVKVKLSNYILTIYNGKYQMDSITTGQ